MFKSTIRCDDDLGQRFDALCAVNGASRNAMIEALMIAVLERHDENDGRPMMLWNMVGGAPAAEGQLDAWARMQQCAMQITAKRRSRRTDAASSTAS